MTAPRPITLALVQHPCSDDGAENLQRTLNGIREAGDRGAKLILLQELHRSRYFCQHQSTREFEQAETIPGPTTQHIAELAGQLGVVVVASVFERRTAGIYHNSAVVIDGGRGIVGVYRKMHIPDDPGYNEKFYFTPGDYRDGQAGFEPIDTSVGRLGVMVCWDQWFPEAARLMTLAGADLLLYPTAIGWDETDDDEERQRQRDAWETVQRGHAIANGIPVAACNRVGFEPAPEPTIHAGAKDTAKHAREGIRFWGSSFIAGPQGEILAKAGTDEASVILATVDVSRNEAVRQVWPFLRDRRLDAYEDLLKRSRH